MPGWGHGPAPAAGWQLQPRGARRVLPDPLSQQCHRLGTFVVECAEEAVLCRKSRSASGARGGVGIRVRLRHGASRGMPGGAVVPAPHRGSGHPRAVPARAAAVPRAGACSRDRSQAGPQHRPRTPQPRMGRVPACRVALPGAGCPGTGGSDLAGDGDLRRAAPEVDRVVTAGDGHPEPRGQRGHQRQEGQWRCGGHGDGVEASPAPPRLLKPGSARLRAPFLPRSTGLLM